MVARVSLFLAVLLAAEAAQAQFVSLNTGAKGVLSSEATRRLGLERVWFTHIEMGAARGKVAGVWQHVSATNVHTIFEVYYDGQTYLFSELDRDAFGVKIGVEKAKDLAEKKLAALNDQLAKLEKKPPVPPPSLESRVVPEISLYVTSERGTVHALDGETGKTKWVAAIGDPALITTQPTANDEFVAALNGSTIYVLKASDGTPAWSRRVNNAPGTGPIMSTDFLFAPMINGKMEVYRLTEPRRAEFVYQSFGRLLVQGISNGRTVAWTSDKGILYAANGSRQGMRFKVTTNDSIVAAPAFLPPDRILVGSIDGYLYCVNEKNGDVQWKFSTGQPIHVPPFGTAEAAYVINDDGGLYAINMADGSEKWWTRGYRRYLASTADRLYVTDISGSLAVLEARSGARIGAIPMPDLDLPIINYDTDRILIGTKSGLLQMLRETSNRWPVMQQNVELKKKKAAPVRPAAGPGGPKEGKPMADPFDDPFGAAPAPKGKAAPKPAEDDPFK